MFIDLSDHWVSTICTFNIEKSFRLFLYKSYKYNLLENLASKNGNFNFRNHFYERLTSMLMVNNVLCGFLILISNIHNLYEIYEKTRVVVLCKGLKRRDIYLYISISINYSNNHCYLTHD